MDRFPILSLISGLLTAAFDVAVFGLLVWVEITRSESFLILSALFGLWLVAPVNLAHPFVSDARTEAAAESALAFEIVVVAAAVWTVGGSFLLGSPPAWPFPFSWAEFHWGAIALCFVAIVISVRRVNREFEEAVEAGLFSQPDDP